MMKIALTGIKRNELMKEIKRYLKNKKKNDGKELRIVSKNADLIICYGGDGSILYSERKYPGIPKIFIYKNKNTNAIKKAIDEILNGDYKSKLEELIKLETYVNEKKNNILAINDVNIHYVPPNALRFYLRINGNKITEELIGDGVVISTPFGSRGYFKSITRKTFKRGIGIAFNNTTKKVKPIILNEDSNIEVYITRGKGVIAIDNYPKLIRIREGDVIKVSKAKENARFYIF